MNKIAELVKEAEVRGVLAALVDGGHLKVASQEEFDALTEVVSASIDGYDHDLDTVLDKTAEVLDYLEDGDFDKEAEYVDETAIMAAIGELSMLKMAGEIDDYTFEKEAGRVMDAGRAAGAYVKNVGGRAYSGAKEYAGKAYSKAKEYAGRAYNETKAIAKAEQARRGLSQMRAAKKKLDNPNWIERAVDYLPGDLRRKALEKAKSQGRRDLLIGAAKTTGLYGAGAAGTAVGGKAIYDKYKDR